MNFRTLWDIHLAQRISNLESQIAAATRPIQMADQFNQRKGSK